MATSAFPYLVIRVALVFDWCKLSPLPGQHEDIKAMLFGAAMGKTDIVIAKTITREHYWEHHLLLGKPVGTSTNWNSKHFRLPNF